jgi:hypothetical protein
MAYSRTVEGFKDAQALALIFRRIRLALVRDQDGVTTISAPTDIKRSRGLNTGSVSIARLGTRCLLPTKVGVDGFCNYEPSGQPPNIRS